MYRLRMSRFVDGEENGVSASNGASPGGDGGRWRDGWAGTGKGGWTANAALIDVCYHQWC